MHLTREATRDASLPHHSSLKEARPEPNINFQPRESCNAADDETWNTLDNIAAMGLTLRNDQDDSSSQAIEVPSMRPEDGESAEGAELAQHAVRPFHKWMRHLHRRARPLDLNDGASWMEPFSESIHSGASSFVGHRKTSSNSSFDLVAAVKSASVSLASASVVTRKRRQNGRTSFYARTERSSRASLSVPRCSEDSTYLEGPSVVDPAVTERLLQRRRILEELISTEESYIGDVKFLSNVSVPNQ